MKSACITTCAFFVRNIVLLFSMKQFKKYNKNYFDAFGIEPNEIAILAYDALGLIYYVWK